MNKGAAYGCWLIALCTLADAQNVNSQGNQNGHPAVTNVGNGHIRPHIWIHGFIGGVIGPNVAQGTTTYMTPALMAAAYKINGVGSGQGATVAIVDAYDAPNVAADLSTFMSHFGISCPTQGWGQFTKVNQHGSASPLPGYDSGWEIETSLDTQWVRAIAPCANIVLVEANSENNSDLMTAVSTAATLGSVVSMSWGESESSSQTSYDNFFVKSGVTFMASSGDTGGLVSWPASAFNVVGVGGTNLNYTNGALVSETVWSGSGGGCSAVEAAIAAQTGFVPSSCRRRGSPDVSMDGGSLSPVYVLVSGQGGWYSAYGTSLSVQLWAGVVAIANGLRGSPLAGTLADLYSDAAGSPSSAPYTSNYRDITSGSAGAFSAGSGWDFVTGLGSPLVNSLVPSYLVTQAGGPPDMTITKTHAGSFTQGQIGATYAITAINSGGTATSAAVSVSDTVPAGLTATGIAGTGWTCTQPAGPCSRSDVLAGGASHPVLTLTVNVAANAPASVTNTATVSGGGETNTSNDTANDPTTIVAPLAGTPFLTGYALNGPVLRNNYGGFVGMKFTVGSTPITVSSLGRICVAGNSGTHTIKLVNASTGTDVAGGSLSLSMAGCTPGQFQYATLPSAILLSANTAYHLVSQEAYGGDQWYDTGTVTSTSVAAVNNSVYFSGTWTPYNGPNTSYVPANFLYSIASGPPDMTITKTHAGSFTQGQIGATYTITAINSGGMATSAAVSVSDAVPAGLTATGIAGAGWTCTQPAGPCSRSDVLAGGASHPVLTLTVNVAANAPASVTNTATVSGGGEANTSNDTANDPTTIVAPLAGTPFLTGYALNGPVLRNNYSDFVGMKFTVGSTPITVSSLGRICVAGNSGTHTIKLVNASTGVDVAGGSLALSMAGCTPGQFQYATLPSAILLSANTAYHLVSQEAYGGDQWYDTGNVSSTSVAAVNNSVYFSGTWTPYSGPNTSYVPANFLYSIASGPPDMTITKTHAGSFTQGQIGATYTITAINSGGTATSAAVSVSDTVPAGLTATGIAGTGWTCTQPAGPCSRSDVLAGGASHPVLTLTVNVAANAPASVTNTATVSGGGETNTSNDTANDPTTIVAPLAGTPFLTGYALNGPVLRNNYGDFVGMKFTVGSTPITVSSLGRICVAGNSGTHTIKLVNASTGVDLAGGSLALSMAGCTPGQFQYATLPSAILLSANTAYHLVSREAYGGDQWYDTGTVTSTSVAAVNNSVYFSGTWTPYSGPNTSYVPANFLYQ